VFRWGWLDLSRQCAQTKTLIDALRIKARSARNPSLRFRGNQQKIAVARLLHQNADVLLLDEPTRGIDIGSKAQVYETNRSVRRDNKAVLMVSSYLPELFAVRSAGSDEAEVA